MSVPLRSDQSLIVEWIDPGSRVLDLGCGDGSLLAYLQAERGVSGYGIEIDPVNIVACIEKGINVLQSDLDAGLSDFDAGSFDHVVMTQTLQAVKYPHLLIAEMLRVGRQGIVTFPNMCHWRARLQFLAGHMPVTRTLPAQWYDTENLHLCSMDDFENLCKEMSLEVLDRTAVDYAHRQNLGMRLLPNLLGQLALYRIRSRAGGDS